MYYVYTNDSPHGVCFPTVCKVCYKVVDDVNDCLNLFVYFFFFSVLSQWYHISDPSIQLLPLFRRTGPGFVQCCEMFCLYQWIGQHHNWMQSGTYLQLNMTRCIKGKICPHPPSKLICLALQISINSKLVCGIRMTKTLIVLTFFPKPCKLNI